MARRKMHLLIPNSITSLCGGYTRQFNPEFDPHFTMSIDVTTCKHCREAYRYHKHWYNKLQQDASLRRMIRNTVLEMLKEFKYQEIIGELVRKELAEMIVARNKMGD